MRGLLRYESFVCHVKDIVGLLAKSVEFLRARIRQGRSFFNGIMELDIDFSLNAHGDGSMAPFQATSDF